MSDIVVSVNEQKLKELLEIYKNNFWGTHWEQEKYKWEGVAEFQDKWDIDAEDFYTMFYNATEKVSPNQGGLFDSQSAYPRANIKKMYKADSQGTRQLFKDLFDESVVFETRAELFLKNAENIWVKCENSEGHKNDQLNAFTTYLWLKYPDEYHIYRYYVCRDLALAINSSYIPYKGSNKNKTFDSIIDSKKFYDKICSIIKKDEEIIGILQKCNDKIIFENPDGDFAKKDYTKWINTLVTDFAFYVRKYMEKKDIDNDVDDEKNKINQPKNIILYGPPGTGKTYNTVFKAMEIVNDKPYDNHDKSTYNEAKAEYDKLTKAGRIQFVTFHQSYSYEDFIEGIKPKIAENEESEQTDSGQVEYKIKDGVFKEFCIAADSNCVIRKKDKDKLQEKKETPTDRYVFIIDEINRGNISKIFGELITLIEETKRKGKQEETSAILPYSGDEFTVPDNVYIIGTMNTADRSLAVVDTALRRRFTFEEMMPDTESDLLNFDIKADGGETINIKNLLKVMNDRITALYDREHTIGHAYFMSLSSSSTIKDLGNIFKNKIIPLLQEYFYEDYEKIRLVLGDNQKTNEPQFIEKKITMVNDLFGNNCDLNTDSLVSYSINKDAFEKKEAYRFLGLVATKATNADNTQESQGSNQ